jgi:hypothetical protein
MIVTAPSRAVMQKTGGHTGQRSQSRNPLVQENVSFFQLQDQGGGLVPFPAVANSREPSCFEQVRMAMMTQ